jgi:DNA-binding cell septation regulator SpoVG
VEISNYRPARPGGNTRAFMDVRFPDGLFIRDLRLVETRNGIRVYGPVVGDRTIVALPSAVADRIAEAVANVGA